LATAQTTRLRAVSDVRDAGGSLREVALFCLEGRLSVGDRVFAVEEPDGTQYEADAEVLEILYFQQMIDELEPVFTGQVLLTGNVGRLADGWTVLAIRP
jgi:hypothetical protein